MKRLLFLLGTLMSSSLFSQQQFSIHDYANFARYENENKNVRMGRLPDVVFMGNSITEGWVYQSPEFFKDNNFAGRGIGGQVTHQMLLRFKKDIIELQPKVVVILAGTNDIAQNAGPVSLDEIMNNISAMAELAKANNIEPILCSVLPAKDYPWHPGLNPLENIPKLNGMIKAYTSKNNIAYADYYEAMQDGQGGMKVPEHTTANDLVHPNKAGYTVMEWVIKPIIDKVLKQ